MLGIAILGVVLCLGSSEPVQAQLHADAMRIVQERNLTPDDIKAALATYTPTGRHDEYVMFASGGHSGQVIVVGLPSMRILKVIAVFTPDPWQGYGYGVKDSPLAASSEGVTVEGQSLTWADTHHPALSETKGDYDGEYLFINDKANGRIAVIDLKDFETKQIVKNPIFHNDHGATMVTPDTEYVVEGSQYAMPLGNEYAPIANYKEKYRGLMTFWKFDRSKGRIVKEESFGVELPPYWQDLADAGKLASDSWVFCGSFNSELATGGIENGNPPFEAGTAGRDMDYLHLINWREAEAAFKAGKVEQIKGFPVIMIETAVAEGLLYLTPEPKSPHSRK
jgi:nitrous-oxide reductase